MPRKLNKNYYSIDLFSGVGGLTCGLTKAGFFTKIAIEIDNDAIQAFKMNHKDTYVIEKDIRKVTIKEVKKFLKKRPLHLLAGCPPCQGFSAMRRLNGSNVTDERNNLILEYLRFVKALRPYTIMMENVPGLKNYYLFKFMLKELKKIGYNLDCKIVNIKDYGVPQRRKRLVLIGSRLGEISIPMVKVKKVTVRDAIGNIESVKTTKDKVHKIFPKHTNEVIERIRLTPKNGGSWADLPSSYKLQCHMNDNIGFNDVYGRLRWDDYSSTITGGCLNASKGRFLHPKENRTISAREAAVLQSFPRKYKFPTNISKDSLALLIGNALPPKFSYLQSLHIKKHLSQYLNA